MSSCVVLCVEVRILSWWVGLELLHEFLCCVVRRSTHYVLLSWWVGLELLHGFLCCVVRRSTHYVLLVGRP